ncbi:MAG TPA: efflux RND transporter permease subunit, partial [Thermoanaerobaculia bacterium]|nr:efflux RND transporter permease subunit [Thermoanaerobaculia bacterium]
MFLSNLSIKRPVFATVLMLALLTLGLFSYRRLAVDMFPDVEFPVVSITTELPGASPESVEREVTRRIEEAVNPIPGVKHVSSVSREGLSSVIVEFELNVKVNDASQDARARLSAIRRELPEAMKDPVIQKMDIGGMPIVSLAVRSTTLGPRELSTLVERRVKRRLENVPGVGKVKLVGVSKREVNVLLDPARLEALGMGVDEVIAGLSSENVNTPLGRINRAGTEVPLRISGKAEDVADFQGMVIASKGGHAVTLGEVAEIVDGIEEPRSLALVNGVPSVALNILKQSKTNTVGVVDAVKKEIGKLSTELPAGTEIALVRDASLMIRESVEDVRTTLIIGGFLTVLIVFCFLNSWRSTVITGLTLPISVISSFIAMYFLGMTLNVMTLMALSLAIGLLIDDAIVVRENIVRHLERGADHFTAAREGTAEIGLAVLSTSLSIVAVFVPVAFMKGIIGRFFFQFGITVTWAVLISLFVSFTLDPMLSSRWIDPDIERKTNRHAIARVLDRFNAWFDRMADRYKAVIGWALDHRRTVLVSAAGAFALGLFLFGLLQAEFMPPFDKGEFLVRFRTAPDASLAETRGRLEEALKQIRALPEVAHTYATIGAAENETVRDAAIFVKLKEQKERKRKQNAVMPDVRQRLGGIAGIIPSVEEDPDSMQKPMQVLIKGEEIPRLKEYAAELKAKLRKIPGLVDLDATLEQDLPEYRLEVDRERARDVGVSTDAIVRTVSALVGGQIVSTWDDEAGESVNVRVRLPEAQRGDVGQVGDLRLAVSSRGRGLVPIGDLVKTQRALSPSEITRRDLSRQVVVSSNLDQLPLGTAGERSMEAAGTLKMAPGYRAVMGGDTEWMIESFGYMAEALVLAIVFVYLILAAQFESFIDPLSIMLSLPLSIVGMAGALLLTGDTVNIMSLIGLILLMGLVTKNAILLVDRAKTLRRGGMERREALISAGRTRLRPILMTTLAMIFGMLPLALAIGQGAEMRAPMARAVVGGLITSTILTLVVIPVVYTFFDDVAGFIHRRWAKASAAETNHLDVDAAARVSETARPLKVPGSLVVLLAALLVPGVARAGPLQAAVPASPESGVVLTLDEALHLAASRGRDVAKAREYQAWVHGKYLEERAAALPDVSLVASYNRQWDESLKAFFGDFIPPAQNNRYAEVQLSQTLFAWGKVGAALRAAKAGIASADDRLDSARQTSLRDATAAFTDVLLAKELKVIAEETLTQRERHLEEARHRQALGTATDYDVLAADVAVQNARPEAIRAANLVALALEKLRVLLALARPIADVKGTLDVDLVAAPRYEDALEKALAARPDLKELAHQITVAQELVKIAKTGDKPTLDFRGAAGWKGISAGDVSADGKTWNAGLYLSFPFFDGLATKGRVLESQSNLATLEIDVAKARDGVALDVRTIVDTVHESAEIVRA